MKVSISLPMNHSAPSNRSPFRGFTLVEVLVTLSVIVILVSIFFGIQRGVYSAQSQAKARAEMAVIASALEAFKSRYGDYPWTDDDGSDINTSTKNALWQAFLFEVLTGELYLGRNSDNEPEMIRGDRRPLTDVGALTVQPPNSTTGTIVDPWGNRYMYYYRTDIDDNSWQNPGFILLSVGENRRASIGSVPSNGIIPKDFFDQTNNHDVIIYGYNN